MWWDYTEVTVKRLHKDVDPYQGGVVDLLINEIEHIGSVAINSQIEDIVECLKEMLCCD